MGGVASSAESTASTQPASSYTLTRCSRKCRSLWLLCGHETGIRGLESLRLCRVRSKRGLTRPSRVVHPRLRLPHRLGVTYGVPSRVRRVHSPEENGAQRRSSSPADDIRDNQPEQARRPFTAVLQALDTCTRVQGWRLPNRWDRGSWHGLDTSSFGGRRSCRPSSASGSARDAACRLVR